jgi:hypothetical protein
VAKTYNIVNDYDWTTIPRGAELRKKAPNVFVRSYKLKSNAIVNRLKNYIQVVQIASSKDFYEKMYGDATEEEDTFFFPYFEDGLRNITNTFGDTFQNGFGEAGGLGGSIENLFKDNLATIAQAVTMATTAEERQGYNKNVTSGNYVGGAKSLNSQEGTGGAAGSYIETPKFYQYGSAEEGSLTVSFKLANTINSDFMEKNYKLVRKLIEINKPKRFDAISLDPPRIYRVRLPGYRYMPWAYIDNLSISMEGTKRIIPWEGKDVIVPEAYIISMGFKPLTIEVSNFLEET